MLDVLSIRCLSAAACSASLMLLTGLAGCSEEPAASTGEVTSAPAPPSSGSLAPRKELPYDVLPLETGFEDAAARIADAVAAAAEVAAEAGAPAPREPAVFRDEVAATLEPYLEGSAAAFQEHAAARGLFMDWLERVDSEDPEGMWAIRSQTLHGAPLSTRGVVLRPRFLAGEAQRYEDGTSTLHAERPERAPWLADPAGSGLDVFEVIVPAEMRSQNGETFPGRFGMWLTWDPEANHWLLTHLSVYDPPSGLTFGMPPL